MNAFKSLIIGAFAAAALAIGPSAQAASIGWHGGGACYTGGVHFSGVHYGGAVYQGGYCNDGSAIYRSGYCNYGLGSYYPYVYYPSASYFYTGYSYPYGYPYSYGYSYPSYRYTYPYRRYYYRPGLTIGFVGHRPYYWHTRYDNHHHDHHDHHSHH